MTPKKILFLQDDFPPHAKGGAGIVVASLASGLVQQGFEVIVVTTVQDPSLAGSFQEDGLRIERLYSDYPQRWRSWRSLYNPSLVRPVARILADTKPNIVHAHNVHYHLSYWTFRLARKGGARVFLTAHDMMLFHYGKLHGFADSAYSGRRHEWNYRVSAWHQFRDYRFWYNPLRNLIIRFLLRNVDHVFAVSAALKDALKQNGIRDVEVLHNGVDVAEWRTSSESVDLFVQKCNLKNKEIILFGGRISRLKGGDVMLATLREIVRVEPTAVLLLLGTRDSYVEQLIKQATEWGIGQHIISSGWLSGEELRAAYHRADVVAVPSLYLDPLPTVVLEAMACGKPVVGSCFGGIPEMVVDGETGWIVNPFDTEDMAQKILSLQRNDSLRVKFGMAGLTRVSHSFSLDGQLKRLLRAYADSL